MGKEGFQPLYSDTPGLPAHPETILRDAIPLGRDDWFQLHIHLAKQVPGAFENYEKVNAWLINSSLGSKTIDGTNIPPVLHEESVDLTHALITLTILDDVIERRQDARKQTPQMERYSKLAEQLLTDNENEIIRLAKDLPEESVVARDIYFEELGIKTSTDEAAELLYRTFSYTAYM